MPPQNRDDATAQEKKSELPPMVSFSVTNPVTYLKQWWNNVMGKEGVNVNFRIHPLTAIALTVVLVAGGAGAGWIIRTVQYNASKVPVIGGFIPTLSPNPTTPPTPDPWRSTAYTGLLKQTGDRFYLVTSEAEAITLEIPQNVSLTKYIGKRILAAGTFNELTGVLVVSDATDLEVLIQSTAVPTLSPSPTPTLMPSANPTEEPSL